MHFRLILDCLSQQESLPNAQFQRIERREKKSFLSKQYKEIEKNDRMEKYLSSRKLEIPRENFIQRWAQLKAEMARI